MTFNLSETNSIGNKFIAQLRSTEVQKDSMRFRRNLERLGEIFAYEISKQLDYTTVEVETPLGLTTTEIPSGRVVLATILRAGLPMHTGMHNYFDDADNAFISAYRAHHKDGTFEINIEYTSCPSLDNCDLIIADPMLATGASMALTIESLAQYGKPKSIHIVTAIASQFGYNHIKRLFPKAHIWVGAIDQELTAKSYIVPGLGDAGDLSFGSKMQE